MAMVGGDILLDCETGGTPLPKIRWTQQGGSIGMNKIKVLDNVVNNVGAAMARSHHLVFDPAEFDSRGNILESHLNIYKIPKDYQIKKEARMALHQQIIEIDSLSSLSSSSIEVSWNTVGNRIFLEGGHIDYIPSSKIYEEFETITLKESRANSFVINNLEGSTKYDLFIQPFYSKIVVLSTSIKQISTEPEVIPAKTVILVAEIIHIIHMTTAFVVWQPYPSHLVSGYEVVFHTSLNNYNYSLFGYPEK